MFSIIRLRSSSLLFVKICKIPKPIYAGYSGSEQDGEDKGDPKEKLNLLLQSLAKQSIVTDDSPPVKVPKARSKSVKLADQRETKPKKSLGKQLVDAAQNLAKSSSDPAKTEAELLHKLLYKDTPLAKDISENSAENTNLTQLVSSMEIDRTQKPQKEPDPGIRFSRSDQVRALVGKPAHLKRKKRQLSDMKRIELFALPPLGIFSTVSEKSQYFSDEKSTLLPTWQACEERELKMVITHPPTSYYEQMIHWTEKGVIWKFPIDNEQGMDEEEKVSFTDHVFLEVHLEDWCPQTGPLRHFMELVCVGLSRNHWLSADEKKEHILWYKNYFLAQRDLLKEIGAGDVLHSEKPSLNSP